MAYHRVPLLVSVTTLAGILFAQPPRLSLERLAASWSAGQDTPLCRSADPDTDWGALPGMQECTWPEVVTEQGRGQVSGRRDEQEQLGAIIWERSVANRAAARRLADSLGTALRPHSLVEYHCPGDGRRWQAPGFGVQINTGAVLPDGLLRLMVVATTDPSAIPTLLCPDAPQLPPVQSAPTDRIGV